ncbi:MAG: hypothetical protein ACOX0X_01415 [Candidatus Dojkabacteria bacterium]
MNRWRTRKIVAIVIFVLIIAACIVSAVYLLRKEDVKGISTERYIVERSVRITNLMPNVAYANVEYLFVPKIDSSNFSDVYLTLVEAPDWMWIDEQRIVRGTPSLEDLGVQKVVLRVEDGSSSSEVVDYIIVEENEE